MPTGAKDRFCGDFAVFAARVIEERMQADELNGKVLADKLGISAPTLSRWILQHRPIPAEILPSLCNVINDLRLLDWLEHKVGRVAYTPKPVSSPPECFDELTMEDVNAIKELMEEFARALGELTTTLKDHQVTDQEYQRTAPQLDAVIRQCTRLKEWLRLRSPSGRAVSSGSQ